MEMRIFNGVLRGRTGKVLGIWGVFLLWTSICWAQSDALVRERICNYLSWIEPQCKYRVLQCVENEETISLANKRWLTLLQADAMLVLQWHDPGKGHAFRARDLLWNTLHVSESAPAPKSPEALIDAVIRVDSGKDALDQLIVDYLVAAVFMGYSDRKDVLKSWENYLSKTGGENRIIRIHSLLFCLLSKEVFGRLVAETEDPAVILPPGPLSRFYLLGRSSKRITKKEVKGLLENIDNFAWKIPQRNGRDLFVLSSVSILALRHLYLHAALEDIPNLSPAQRLWLYTQLKMKPEAAETAALAVNDPDFRLSAIEMECVLDGKRYPDTLEHLKKLLVEARRKPNLQSRIARLIGRYFPKANAEAIFIRSNYNLRRTPPLIGYSYPFNGNRKIRIRYGALAALHLYKGAASIAYRFLAATFNPEEFDRFKEEGVLTYQWTYPLDMTLAAILSHQTLYVDRYLMTDRPGKQDLIDQWPCLKALQRLVHTFLNHQEACM